jgi:hypothetical protein
MSEEKIKKSARIDLRVVPELNERAIELAKQVSKSKNALIEHIIWKAVLSPEKFFVLCPTCKVPLFDVEELGVFEGTTKVKCDNGHVHTFDFESEKFEL